MQVDLLAKRESKTDDYYVEQRDECETRPAKASNPLSIHALANNFSPERFITTPGFFAFPTNISAV